MAKIKKITNMHEFIEAVNQICSNKLNKKEYMSIKQSNKKITENFINRRELLWQNNYPFLSKIDKEG